MYSVAILSEVRLLALDPVESANAGLLVDNDVGDEKASILDAEMKAMRRRRCFIVYSCCL
jgi:hypothetical protein